MFIAGSVVLHGGAFAVISQAARRDRAETASAPPLELVMFEVENRSPPPIEEAKAPPSKPIPKAPIKVASVKSPKPRETAPPPPNETPPAATPPQPAPLVVGLTMSSTTTGGSFPAPVGNTLYGKTETKAPSPEDVKPYSAPRYVPIYQVDSQPTVLHEEKIPYPPGPMREGNEGTVWLSIVIDAEGNVVSAKVLSGPGHGLNEAALDACRRFRFRPAIKSGQPVSTEMKYKYIFALD
jgi:protein TonB